VTPIAALAPGSEKLVSTSVWRPGLTSKRSGSELLKVRVSCGAPGSIDAAWGGPMYYGHSPHGYSRGNLFYYQTRSVMGLYAALNGAQRAKAIVMRP
jgi:hypothetical protein